MPRGTATTPDQFRRYRALRNQGWTQREAARKAKMSISTAQRHDANRSQESVGPRQVGRPRRRERVMSAGAGPIPLEHLSEEARRALEDFGFFQRRYFGRIATPWQEEAAYRVKDLMRTPVKEFAVENAPPGSGKSTTFTLDIPAWLTCQNRAIRGLMGSKVESAARKYVARLRRELERTVPYEPESELIDKGLAVVAEATLAADFGSFKPDLRDVWSAEGFVVAQHGNVAIAEKEPTWSAYGMDSGFLGMRYDFIVWDDLVDKLVLRTVESRENQQEWWDDVAEKRLEPGGLLLLQGQRMGPDDLYRYCLDKRTDRDDEDDESPTTERKYHHIVFKAHYDDRCEGQHRLDSPYYPDGCLLDPRRLPWRELKAEMANPRNNFAVIYQQEDVDPESVLVDPLWVHGGTDPRTGQHYAGCLDRDRDACQIPSGLNGTLLSVATVDPSAAKWWAIEWWVVRCVDGQAQERYLMDLVRRKMDAATFLDWHSPTGRFSGLAEEWQQRSIDLNLPIRTWIVEANAAQRYLLAYEHVHRWMGAHRVDVWPHQTTMKKNDSELGVQGSVGPLYRYGLVRLPYRDGGTGRLASLKLIEEATHWPQWRTEDTVMAQWFLEFNLHKMIPAAKALPKQQRPSWLRNTSTWNWRKVG